MCPLQNVFPSVTPSLSKSIKVFHTRYKTSAWKKKLDKQTTPQGNKGLEKLKS